MCQTDFQTAGPSSKSNNGIKLNDKDLNKFVKSARILKKVKTRRGNSRNGIAICDLKHHIDGAVLKRKASLKSPVSERRSRTTINSADFSPRDLQLFVDSLQTIQRIVLERKAASALSSIGNEGGHNSSTTNSCNQIALTQEQHHNSQIAEGTSTGAVIIAEKPKIVGAILKDAVVRKFFIGEENKVPERTEQQNAFLGNLGAGRSAKDKRVSRTVNTSSFSENDFQLFVDSLGVLRMINQKRKSSRRCSLHDHSTGQIQPLKPRIVGAVLKTKEFPRNEKIIPRSVNTDSFTESDLELFAESLETLRRIKRTAVTKGSSRLFRKSKICNRSCVAHCGSRFSLLREVHGISLGDDIKAFIEEVLGSSKICESRNVSEKMVYWSYIVESMLLSKF